MASYCECKLTINSTNAELLEQIVRAGVGIQQTVWQRLTSAVGIASSKPTGLLNFFHPMPHRLRATVTNGIPYPAPDPEPEWKPWSIENWGCGYDFVAELERRTETQLELHFSSRYSPPVAALIHGAQKKQFSFRMLYCSPEGCFCGIATQDENQEFELMLEKPPIEEGIPQELIDSFNLDTYYQEALLDQ